MKKSSRFWWLHGAILLTAAIGCKNCGSGGCGGSSGVPPYGGPSSGAPIASGGPTMYSQSPAGFPAGSSMPSGSSYPSSSGMGYPAPNMSSAMPQGLGSTRP